MTFTLNHTSPSIINTINSDHDYFEGTLFFSTNVYVMTCSSEVHLYTLEIEEDQVIDYQDLEPSKEMIEEAQYRVKSLFDITLDDDEAWDLITTNDTHCFMGDFEDEENCFKLDGFSLGELSWYVQGYQAKTARENGFVACRSEDEQGTVYAIHLVNREDLLTYKGLI
tara:strand:- start:6335 stop:6838 length:504 start_codon:yes stop_codon:yes gene_type:complete